MSKTSKKVYLFNYALWKSLFDQLGVDSRSVRMEESERVIRSIRSESSVRMRALVELCNNYRLDIRQFFVESGKEMTLRLDVSVKGKWSPVCMDESLLSGVGRRAPRHPDVLDAMNTHGISLESLFGLDVTEDEPGGTESRRVNDDMTAVGNSRFNADLFGMLPGLLHVGRIHIGLLSGHASTMWQRVQETGNISMQGLVDVCNAFRLDIGEFFSETYSEHVVHGDEGWKDIVFRNDRLRGLYVGADSVTDLTTLCAKTGFTRIRIERYVQNRKAMQADDMLKICKACGVAPSYFWDSDSKVVADRMLGDVRNDLQIAMNTAHRAKVENLQLQARIRHLEAMLDMKKE